MQTNPQYINAGTFQKGGYPFYEEDIHIHKKSIHILYMVVFDFA